jgi:hypothetical protein
MEEVESSTLHYPLIVIGCVLVSWMFRSVLYSFFHVLSPDRGRCGCAGTLTSILLALRLRLEHLAGQSDAFIKTQQGISMLAGALSTLLSLVSTEAP